MGLEPKPGDNIEVKKEARTLTALDKWNKDRSSTEPRGKRPKVDRVQPTDETWESRERRWSSVDLTQPAVAPGVQLGSPELDSAEKTDGPTDALPTTTDAQDWPAELPAYCQHTIHEALRKQTEERESEVKRVALALEGSQHKEQELRAEVTQWLVSL